MTGRNQFRIWIENKLNNYLFKKLIKASKIIKYFKKNKFPTIFNGFQFIIAHVTIILFSKNSWFDIRYCKDTWYSIQFFQKINFFYLLTYYRTSYIYLIKKIKFSFPYYIIVIKIPTYFTIWTSSNYFLKILENSFFSFKKWKNKN